MITLSGVIDASDLNDNSDEETAQILANLKAGAEDHYIPLEVASLDVDTALRDRHVIFTPQTDMEVRVLRVAAYGPAATRTTTLTLDACDPLGVYSSTAGHPALAEYMLDKTVSATVTSTSAAWYYAESDYRTTTGERHFLLGGVSYRLALSSTALAVSPIVRAQAGLLLRGRRRTR